MAKTNTAADLTPFVFVPALPVLSEHQREIHELQNFAVARRPPVYMNLNGSPFHGLALAAPAGDWLYFGSSIGTYATVIRGHARINPEVQSLRVSARCYFFAGSAGEVRFEIGATNTVLTVTDADNGDRVTGTLLTSATGTGLVTIRIDIRATVNGLSSTNYVNNLRVQSEVIAAADLPDPINS